MAQIVLLCPNPECPSQKKFGHAAEYREGVSQCAECGAALVSVEEPRREAASPSPTIPLFASEAPRRLLVSLGLVGLAEMLSRVPLVEADLVPGAPPGEPLIALFSLGLTNVFLAFVLVELVALIAPRWRALRVCGPERRRPLALASWILALVLVVIQAYFLSAWAESIWSQVPTPHGSSPAGESTRGMMVIALVGGTGILAAIGRLGSRYGLGNGFSWLLAWGAVQELLRSGGAIVEHVVQGSLAPKDLLWIAVCYALIIYFGVRLLRASAQVPLTGGPPLVVRLPTCGLLPLEMAASALGLLLWSLMYTGSTPDPERPLFDLFRGATIVGAGAVLTRLFYYPAIIDRFLSRFGATIFSTYRARGEAGSSSSSPSVDAPRRENPYTAPAITDDSRRIDAGFRRTLLRSGGWSVGYLLGAELLPGFLLHRMPWRFVGSWRVLVLIAVLLDLGGEWRARRRARRLCKVWEVHRLYEVAVMEDLLRQEGLTPSLRGLHHRSLLYFFGPYLPVEVFVPEEEAERAQTILAPYRLDREA